jgi:hypothetical protein
MYYGFSHQLFVLMRALSKFASKITSGVQLTIFGVFEKVQDDQDYAVAK